MSWLGKKFGKKVISRYVRSLNVLDAFRKANNELLIEAAGKSPLAKEVIESQQTFLNKAKHWPKITDADYL